MISGRFGSRSGRPYLVAHIIIPTLDIAGPVPFLLDTGADQTVLMPVDSIRLGIDLSKLSNTTKSLGVGGVSTDFLERAAIVILDADTLHSYDVDLIVMQHRGELMSAPSLLGRNVMNRWKAVFDHTQGTLTVEVRNADAQIKLEQSDLRDITSASGVLSIPD